MGDRLTNWSFRLMGEIWFYGSGRTAFAACERLFLAGYRKVRVWAPDNDKLAICAYRLGLPRKGIEDHGVRNVIRPQPELVISFLCPVKIPLSILSLAKYGGINFHPAPLPKYRGVHCAAFAVMNREAHYGVTCHFMTERLDDGPILLCEPCAIYPKDNEADLEERAKRALLRLFQTVVDNALWKGTHWQDLTWPRSGLLYTKRMYQDICLKEDD